ncbi:MAG TPA: HD domain-containing phosphohydrolase [Nannocystaceae bacterium]|nr:HD domain-containing phosphohydrolase [Nannocystaceae bacterium]
MSGTLDDFARVRAHVLARGRTWGRIDVAADGTVSITKKRAHVVLLDAQTAWPPEHYDVLIAVAPAELLGEALARLRTPRVVVLPLPATTLMVERVVGESLRSATAYDRANMADRLLEIGTALAGEREADRVLALILEHARELTNADAGSIYLVEGDRERLVFKVAHNESVQADLSEFSIPVNPQSIVGSAVLRGTCVRVDDLYADADPHATMPPWSHDRSFDKRFGYQTRSMITTPMITPDGRVVGVIQLINARRDKGKLETIQDFAMRVEPFTEEDEKLCSALAAQGAVALDNARLYAEIQALFEGFVRASVLAIEQRDPTTSGHSQRVADLTVALASAADRADSGPYRDIAYSREQLREIQYAGLLHDFGKVGVREEVLVKAKKLYPHQLDLVVSRFDHMRTVLKLRLLEQQLARAKQGLADDADLLAAHAEQLARLDAAIAAVTTANEPSILPQAVSSQLPGLAELAFANTSGELVHPIGRGELLALGVRRGSLTPSERDEIQQHVTHTYNFLVQIPWGRHLQGVPDIAGKHHEYLDGSGYPSHVAAAGIPLQARMMTVSDIFDALTASDRPYKRAVPIPQALEILRGEATVGKVDHEVLDLFIGAKIHESIGAPRT